MKISRQGAAIAATVAVILGGSAGAYALAAGSSDPAPPTVQQVADEPSPSATASTDATPSSSPSSVPPSSSPSTAPPAQPSSTTKERSNVTTATEPPAEPDPTTEPPAPSGPPGATAGQNNGGSGTVDNGPYPSRMPDPTPSASATS